MKVKETKPKYQAPVSDYWLVKSEPEVFSIDHLKKNKTTLWEGVRNYAARNHMTSMKLNDEVLFYHSSCEVPGVVGIATVSKLAVPDPAQFDKKSDYYDPKATKEKPIWFCVEIKFLSTFKKVVSLEDIKKDKTLSNMVLIKRGRLSVQTVTAAEFSHIKKLGQ